MVVNSGIAHPDDIALPGGEPGVLPKTPNWETLADRLQWVMDLRRMSAREWSSRAFDGKNLQQVSTMMARSREAHAERGAETEIYATTMEKLARVTDVRVEWLQKGIGEPERPRYEEMGFVRHAALQAGIPESFIAEYESTLDLDAHAGFWELYQPLEARFRSSGGRLTYSMLKNAATSARGKSMAGPLSKKPRKKRNAIKRRTSKR